MSDQTPPPPANPYGGPPPGQPYAPQGQPYGAQGDPYNAPAQPYGQQPQPFGAPPPQGGQPQPGGQPQFGEAYPPVPQKKGGAGKKVLSIIGAIVAVLVVVGLKVGVRNLFSEDDKTADAKVGDCIGELPKMAVGEEKEANAEIVKCGDAAAQFTVVGRVDNQTKAQAEKDDVCDSFEGVEASYLVTKDGSKYYVLCLKPVAAK